MSHNKDEKLNLILEQLPNLVSLLEQHLRERRISGALYVNTINKFIQAYKAYKEENK